MSDLTRQDLDEALNQFYKQIERLASDFSAAKANKGSKNPTAKGNKNSNYLDDARVELEKLSGTTKGLTKVMLDQIKHSKDELDLEKDLLRKKSRAVQNLSDSLASGSFSIRSSMTNVADMMNNKFINSLRLMSGGMGFAYGAIKTLAKSAAEFGNYADLGAISAGSIHQYKILSGLGDSFIKVVADSRGGFKSFGDGSEDAIKNLAQMSRAFRSGSSYINSSVANALGPAFVAQIDKIAETSAGLGMSQEQTAEMMGSITGQIALSAKSPAEALQRLTTQAANTVTSARDMSNAFGVSAKQILDGAANFRKSIAGRVAGLQGVNGAEDIANAIKASTLGVSDEDANTAALLMKQGRMGEARTFFDQFGQGQTFDLLAQDTARVNAGQYKNMTDALKAGAGRYESLGKAMSESGGVVKGNTEQFNSGGTVWEFAKNLTRSQAQIAADQKKKGNMMGAASSEAKLIESINELENTMRWWGASLVAVGAGIVGAVGILATVLGAGALSGGIAGLLKGKAKDILGGMGEKISGGIGKSAATTGGVIGNSVPGAASGGGVLSGLVDSLNKLSLKTVGVSTAALLGLSAGIAAIGGALYIAAPGFKAFGEVEWGSLAKAGIVIGALGAAMIAVGVVGAAAIKPLLLGLGVLTIISAGIYVASAALGSLGGAFEKLGGGFTVLSKIDWTFASTAAVGLLSLAGSMTVFGLAMANPITLIGMYVGAKALSAFATSLSSIETSKLEILGKTFIDIGTGIEKITKGIETFDSAKFLTFKEGIEKLGDLPSSTFSMPNNFDLPDTNKSGIPELGAMTSEQAERMLSYLSEIQNNSYDIRTNTKPDMLSKGTRLQ